MPLLWQVFAGIFCRYPLPCRFVKVIVLPICLDQVKPEQINFNVPRYNYRVLSCCVEIESDVDRYWICPVSAELTSVAPSD